MRKADLPLTAPDRSTPYLFEGLSKASSLHYKYQKTRIDANRRFIMPCSFDNVYLFPDSIFKTVSAAPLGIGRLRANSAKR